MSGYSANSLPPVASLSGSELLASDTGLGSGLAPQSAALSAIRVAGSQPINFRNAIDGGDFTVNPWQRGTSFTGIANALTYTADRFFAVGGASSSISVSQQAVTTVAGFGNALQFGRANANANTAAISLGQVIETADAIRFQGQQATVSFWAVAGANFSAASNLLSVTLATGTGTNQSASSLIAGTWTGYAAASLSIPFIANGALVNTAATGVSLTTTWTRYQLTGVIPAGATQIGLLLGFTPVGTAGAADYFQIMGLQLEAVSAKDPFASQFEHRDIEVELALAQRYFFQINEPASGVVVGAGMNTGASAQLIFIPLPVQMYKAPTVTVSAGTFKTNQAGTATATTITAGTTHTPNYISINGSSAGTAGQATLLQGGGGSGYIQVSSDF